MNVTMWAKRALLGVLSAGTSAVIAACYGVFMGDYEDPMVDGAVTDQGQGVQGLEVCATLTGDVAYDNAACATSEGGGYYEIWGSGDLSGRANDEGFLLTVRDVDGDANGTYEPVAITIEPGQIPLTYDIELGDEPLDDDDSAGDDDTVQDDDDDDSTGDDDSAR